MRKLLFVLFCSLISYSCNKKNEKEQEINFGYKYNIGNEEYSEPYKPASEIDLSACGFYTRDKKILFKDYGYLSGPTLSLRRKDYQPFNLGVNDSINSYFVNTYNYNNTQIWCNGESNGIKLQITEIHMDPPSNYSLYRGYIKGIFNGYMDLKFQVSSLNKKTYVNGEFTIPIEN